MTSSTSANETAAVSTPVAARESRARSVFRVVSGNFLEMYDFTVYGYYAAAIAATFFPTGNEFASLMLALSVFGAGFLMRPVGALVLGAYIDHHGRRKGLILSLMLMAIGTACVAFVPSYASIGLLAPAVVLFGRLLQGFSAGVELGGVSVYLSEIATKGNRGFYCSWQSASQQVAVVFAASLGVLLNRLIPASEMNTWGWRIPFIVGCLIVPFLFYVRRSLQETEAFAARRHHPGMAEIARSMVQHARLIFAGMGLVVIHADVRQGRAEAHVAGFAARHGLRRRVELHLAADCRCRVRSHRPPSRADCLYRTRDSHRLSGHAMDGGATVVRASVAG
jgi:MFS family permease